MTLTAELMCNYWKKIGIAVKDINETPIDKSMENTQPVLEELPR